MLSNARIRWALLLSILGMTLVAMFYPLEEGGIEQAATLGARPRKPVLPVSAGVLPVLAMADAELPVSGDDPFAPRGWTAPAPPPPPPTPVAAPAAVAAIDLVPQGPPELPFRYVGNLVDGAEQVVYLARGDQAYVLRAGDAVDGTYKVLGISPTQIEFEHTPTGAKQALVFPVREN